MSLRLSSHPRQAVRQAVFERLHLPTELVHRGAAAVEQLAVGDNCVHLRPHPFNINNSGVNFHKKPEEKAFEEADKEARGGREVLLGQDHREQARPEVQAPDEPARVLRPAE